MIIWKLKLKEQESPFGDNYHCAKISGRLINKNNSYRMETIVSTDNTNNYDNNNRPKRPILLYDYEIVLILK